MVSNPLLHPDVFSTRLIFIPKIRMWKEDKRVSLVSKPRATNDVTGGSGAFVGSVHENSNWLMDWGYDPHGEDVDLQKMEIERLTKIIEELEEKLTEHTTIHPSEDQDTGCLVNAGSPP